MGAGKGHMTTQVYLSTRRKPTEMIFLPSFGEKSLDSLLPSFNIIYWELIVGLALDFTLCSVI